MEFKDNNLNKIIHSFIMLLQRKPYEKITIKEICENAQVSRQTFYNHYSSKDQVFKDFYLQCMKKKCLDNITSIDFFSSDEFIKYIIDFYDEYSDIFIVLKKWDLLNHFTKDIIDYLNTIILKRSQDEYIIKYPEYFLLYTLESVCSICLAWIKQDKKESKEELFQIIRHFTNRNTKEADVNYSII